MDQIKHNYVQVDKLKLHVAEIGSESSPAVLFLHGFPEIWYTWRHQMIAIAEAGFRVIAPDYRGYGLSDVPAEPEKTSFVDLVTDIAIILQSLAISKVFVIAKDFGSMVGYIFSIFFPEKLAGIVTLGVPYMPPQALQQIQTLPEGFYMRRWQEPGRAEADFGRFDAKTVVRGIYVLFSERELPIAGENEEIMDLVDPTAPLPSWLTEEDLDIYATSYKKSGFLTALHVPYRSLLEKVEPPNQDPNNLRIETPALFITGDKDFFFNIPGMEEYLTNGVKNYVPNLEIIFVPEGSHFVHEQFPDKSSFFNLIVKMDQIKHNYIQVDGLKLHVAELGSESLPVVLLLHGFPEIWYTWRHQMVAVAKAGFRVIAPEYREKVAGIVTIGVPYMPPQALQQLQTLPEGFYMRRWQEPGRAEADFGRFDAKTVVRKIYILFSSSEVPIADENQEIMDMMESSAPLPPWFTEEDLEIYGASYEKTGFLTALQVPYRSLSERVEPPNQDPNDLRIEAPALFITGKQDFFFNIPGMEEYLQNGAKKYVPNLEIVYLPEGSHFVQEQFPDKVNQLLLGFLKHNKY
ncbi:Epoxide hydrolase-like protein [Cynara cardunculus var. scolymus]|uniref:Epoxide hydrolase-like protein n=1 Tax=Cynara cardunculus var. scolymus TaxID=59895 RepID=A0A118JTE6_CYNCS|nr:Epoxide hydrolase-like protein [Cynara cardunculus var. scolymus]